MSLRLYIGFNDEHAIDRIKKSGNQLDIDGAESLLIYTLLEYRSQMEYEACLMPKAFEVNPRIAGS
jgi:hypothetical protein